MTGKILSSTETQSEDRVEKKEEIIDWSAKTILIAEDEDVNFIYLENALSKTNATVLRAKNGQEAVDMAKITPAVDLILMDIRMPIMNGLEATKVIKSFRNDVVVVAQTAFAMEEDRQNCNAVGVDDFLSKPVRYKLLIETLKKHLK